MQLHDRSAILHDRYYRYFFFFFFFFFATTTAFWGARFRILNFLGYFLLILLYIFCSFWFLCGFWQCIIFHLNFSGYRSFQCYSLLILAILSCFLSWENFFLFFLEFFKLIHFYINPLLKNKWKQKKNKLYNEHNRENRNTIEEHFCSRSRFV